MRIDETYFSGAETCDDTREELKEDFFDYRSLVDNYDFVFMLHMYTSKVFPPGTYSQPLPAKLERMLEVLPSIKDASEIYLLYGCDPFPPLKKLKIGKRNFYYKSFESDEAPNDIHIFFGINAKFRNYETVKKTMETLSNQINGTKVKFYLAAVHGNIIYHPDAEMAQIPMFIDIDEYFDDENTDMFYSLLVANE